MTVVLRLSLASRGTHRRVWARRGTGHPAARHGDLTGKSESRQQKTESRRVGRWPVRRSHVMRRSNKPGRRGSRFGSGMTWIASRQAQCYQSIARDPRALPRSAAGFSKSSIGISVAASRHDGVINCQSARPAFDTRPGCRAIDVSTFSTGTSFSFEPFSAPQTAPCLIPRACSHRTCPDRCSGCSSPARRAHAPYSQRTISGPPHRSGRRRSTAAPSAESPAIADSPFLRTLPPVVSRIKQSRHHLAYTPEMARPELILQLRLHRHSRPRR